MTKKRLRSYEHMVHAQLRIDYENIQDKNSCFARGPSLFRYTILN